MMHPDYKGGDGELLWNIYYGDFSDDERFDDFRNDQLWDAQVIRPIIEEDVKYARFQLANWHQTKVTHDKSSGASYTWLWLLISAIAVYAAYTKWQNRPKAFINIDEQDTTQPLINYRSAETTEAMDME